MIGIRTVSDEVCGRIEACLLCHKAMREYDYAIVNDHVPLAAERVKRVIEAEHFRVG